MCIWVAYIDIQIRTHFVWGKEPAGLVKYRVHNRIGRLMCKEKQHPGRPAETSTCCYTMRMKSDTTTMHLVRCTLGLFVTTNLKVLAALDGLHRHSLACVALQSVWGDTCTVCNTLVHKSRIYTRTCTTYRNTIFLVVFAFL